MKLRVLLVEDSPDDALLLQHELLSGGFDLTMHRVETAEQMKQALDESWDIVIADYILPKFSGLDAFEIVKQSGKDIPVIIVSGKIGEDTAVEAMRAGVHDYITKGNLARLIASIKHELRDTALRREHKKVQNALEKAREQMERQRHQEREMRLLGQLVSGVAHEVRNPLNAISSLLEALFMELGDSEIIRPYRKHIDTQVQRMNHLMLDLLELGKPSGDDRFSRISISKVCTSMVELWNHAPASGSSTINFTDDTSGDLLVQGDPNRFQQVLVNLIENASEHSETRSTIDLKMEQQGSFLHLYVVDKGSGIKPEYLPLIFDPFFTTRKSGTGLGLGIARRIIEAHGGELRIKNNENGPGVSAEIILPLDQNAT